MMLGIKIDEKKRKWWVLAAMSSCCSVIFLDQSVMPVALPTIHREFAMSELGMQWIINSYLLALTTLVLAGGRLGDMLGHRKIFTIGMLIFGIASIFCGFSYSTEWLIMGRVLQGIGGSLIIPTAPAMLAPAFPHNQQGRAFGLYIGIGALFLSLGPIVGGVFTQYLNWRYIFWVNIPIIILGLLLTYICVHKSPQRKDESFDYLGFFTTAFGIVCIVMGIMQGSDWGWTHWSVPTLIFTGIFLILALALFDRDVKDPFIDYRLFRDMSYIAGNCCVFITQFLLMLTIFWAIYFQATLHYSPSFAGLWSMIASCPVLFFSHVAGYLADRFGPKLPILLGFFLIAIGITWFVLVPTPPTPWYLLPFTLCFGSGVTMVMLPSFTLSMMTVPPYKRGIASGINNTLRQFSSTLGLAAFGQIFLSLQVHLFQKRLLSDDATASLDPLSFDGLLVHSQSATQAFNALSAPVAEKVYSSYFSTYVLSSNIINVFGIGLAILGFLCAFLLIKWGRYKQKETFD